MAKCPHTLFQPFPSNNSTSSSRYLLFFQLYDLHPSCCSSFLNMISFSAPKRSTNVLTHFFKAFRKECCKMGWYLAECHSNSSDHWLEEYQEILANGSIANQTNWSPLNFTIFHFGLQPMAFPMGI